MFSKISQKILSREWCRIGVLPLELSARHKYRSRDQRSTSRNMQAAAFAVPPSVSTLYNVCSVHRGMFSTSGVFSTLGGYHEYIGGI